MEGSYVKVFMTVQIGFLGDVKLCSCGQGGPQTLNSNFGPSTRSKVSSNSQRCDRTELTPSPRTPGQVLTSSAGDSDM